jgi:hypothetical protein
MAQQPIEINSSQKTTNPGIANLPVFIFIHSFLLTLRVVLLVLRLFVSLTPPVPQVEKPGSTHQFPKNKRSSGTKDP